MLALVAGCSDYQLYGEVDDPTPPPTAVITAEEWSPESPPVPVEPADEPADEPEDPPDPPCAEGDGGAPCCEPGERLWYMTAPDAIASRLSVGDGTFEPAEALPAPPPGSDLRFLASVDVDGDDQSELLTFRVADRALFATTCDGDRWDTRALGTLPALNPAAWGDVDGDGCLDYVAYDYGCCTFGNTNSGTGDGYTFLGACDGTFTAVAHATFDVRFLAGDWVGGLTYNLADWDDDGDLDLVVWSLAHGGSTPSKLWYLKGDGQGGFAAAVALPDLPQAGNSGALGDVDGDGCADWVHGANDDGQAGRVFAYLGDCDGGTRGAVQLVDLAAWAVSQGLGAIYGDGWSRLWDIDGDGDLDLVTSFNQVASGPGAVLVWLNDGDGGFGAQPVEVAVPLGGAFNVAFVTPLLDPG